MMAVKATQSTQSKPSRRCSSSSIPQRGAARRLAAVVRAQSEHSSLLPLHSHCSVLPLRQHCSVLPLHSHCSVLPLRQHCTLAQPTCCRGMLSVISPFKRASCSGTGYTPGRNQQQDMPHGRVCGCHTARACARAAAACKGPTRHIIPYVNSRVAVW